MNLDLIRILDTRTKSYIMKLMIFNHNDSIYGSEIADLLSIQPAVVSRAIRELVEAEYVICNKKGSMKFYSLNKRKLRKELKSILKQLTKKVKQ